MEVTDEVLKKVVVVFQGVEYVGKEIKSKWFLSDIVYKIFLTKSEYSFNKELNGGVMKVYVNDRGDDIDKINFESLP